MRRRTLPALALLASVSGHGCTETATARARITDIKATVAGETSRLEGSFLLDASSGSEATEIWLYDAQITDGSTGAVLRNATFETDAAFPLELHAFSGAEALIHFQADNSAPVLGGLSGFCAAPPSVSIHATIYDEAADTGGSDTGFARVVGLVTPVTRAGSPPDATQFHASWTRELSSILTNAARDSAGSLLITMTSTGGTFSLAKLDSRGNLGWTRPLPFGSLPRVAAGGDVVIVSDTYLGTIELLSTSLTSMGGQDVYIARIDAVGGPIWARSFGDAGEQVLQASAVGTQGEVFAVVQGSVDFGNGAPTAGPWSLGKLDADGNCVFGRTIGGMSSPPTVLVPTPSGGVILGGPLLDSESLDLGGEALLANGNAIWLGELDAAGAHLWSRLYVAPGFDSVDSAALGPDGHLTLTGSVSIDADELGIGSPGAFVTRLDATGELLWAHLLQPSGMGQQGDVIVDAAGHTFVAGLMGSSTDLGGGTLDVDPAMPMQYLLELDEAGEHVRSELIACNGSGRFAHWAAPTSDMVLIGGFSTAAALGAGTLVAPVGSYVAGFPPAE